MRIQSAILLSALFLCAACDHPTKTAQSKTSSATTGSTHGAAHTDAPVAKGKFAIDKLQINASQRVYKTKGLPSPDDVRDEVHDKLMASPAFDPGGTRKLSGAVTYDVRKFNDPKAGPVDDVAIIVALAEKGDGEGPHARLQGTANVRATDLKSKNPPTKTVVDRAVTDAVDAVITHAHISAASDAELVEIIKNEKESERTHLVAIQEARERQPDGGAAAIRPYLKSDDASLQVAASAALVKYGDKDSYSDIIKLAETMSRNKNRRLVPLIHVIGEMDSPEGQTYLEALAEGHSAPMIRKIAREVLQNKSKRRKKLEELEK